MVISVFHISIGTKLNNKAANVWSKMESFNTIFKLKEKTKHCKPDKRSSQKLMGFHSDTCPTYLNYY